MIHSLSDDGLKLLEALEAKFGRRIQFYDGQVYFDCQRLDMAKIEADYLKWKAQQSSER